MKIAIIHSHLNDRGGSQRYVIEIAKNLELLGVDVDVFAYEYNEKACYPELTKELNINYLYTRENNCSEKLPFLESALNTFVTQVYNIKIVQKAVISLGLDYIYSMRNTLVLAKSIANLISEKSASKKYDLVFAHEEPLSVWAGIEYKKRSNTPIYWFCYDTIEKWFLEWKEEHKNSKIRSFLLRNLYFKYDNSLVCKYVDQIAVLDDNMAKRVERLYGRKPIVRRGGIPENVLSYKRTNFIRRKFRVDDSKVIIFSLTRFVAYRRVHDVFDLYIKLPEHIKNKLFFYINAPITDDAYYQTCQEKYSEIFKNSSFVIDTSYPKNDTEMYNMHLSSNIFIYPNQNQTWGHAPLEAMACGCMALVSDGCGIHEVIGNITPTVYEVGNINMLNELFISLIENENYRNFASLQKNYVSKNLTWNKVCEQYMKDFNDIISYPNEQR